MIFIYPGTLKARKNRLLRVFKDEPVAWLCDFHKGRTMEQIISEPVLDGSKAGSTGLPFVYFVNEPVEKISAWQKEIEQEGLDLQAMAIATEENRSWTLRQLMDEVRREADYFRRRDYLAQRLSQVDRARFARDEDYRRCYLLAADLLREEELSEKMLDTAIAIIDSFSKEKKQ